MITRRSLIELFFISPIAYFFNISKNKLSPTYVGIINEVLKDRYGTVQYYTFKYESEQPAINKKHFKLIGFPAKQVLEITYKTDEWPSQLMTHTYECFTNKPYFDIAKFIASPMVGHEHVVVGACPHKIVDGDKYMLLSVCIDNDPLFEGN